MNKTRTILLLSIITIVLGMWCKTSFAENIDPNNDNSQFAYGENAGWINFEPTGGGAEVTDSALTGDIWAENIGWIRLNPPFGGVSQDGSGNLSGYAWSETAGWINFNSTNGGGVTIGTSTGDFDGFAWGENIGWIDFQNTCPAYKVNTSWRGNVAPTGADIALTVAQNGTYTVTAANFGYSDTDSDTMLKVQITTLETVGRLTLDGTHVTLNQEITKVDIDANKLKFAPVLEGTGTPYTIISKSSQPIFF